VYQAIIVFGIHDILELRSHVADDGEEKRRTQGCGSA